ncbi:probable Tic20 family protein Ycf60 at C-terminar half [Coccomyxa sp. Obi]|nr:probable Tic20 family protein Ycf60 at C-terminar half [Coccomyxa sp. Obi]
MEGLVSCSAREAISCLNRAAISPRISNLRINRKLTTSASLHREDLSRSSICRHNSLSPGLRSIQQQRAGRKPPRQAVTPVRAADAASVPTGNRGPPSLLVRLASAFLYIVPWIDILTLGREIYHFFPTSLLLYLVPGPLAPLYYSGQFVPLIVFFLLFLAIVKNNKLHHFVRFNCMQGVMLDIVSMLFTLLRAYVPAEVRWSFILDIYDMFSWNICMCTILYCVFFSLAGKYADVPYISESVYLQVDASL